MAKREFLLLAHEFDLRSHQVAGRYLSEKLDGMRAFWDGGISRGLPTASVPFANTEKDARLLTEQVATGLWSRYGKAIQAPDWWLDNLPPFPLDGELYGGRGNFQSLMSTVKQLTPDERWANVRYHVFDSPPMNVVFGGGKINNINFKKTFFGVDSWAESRLQSNPMRYCGRFEDVYNMLNKLNIANRVVVIHEQTLLPFSYQSALDTVNEKLFEVCEAGGEGLMIRDPSSFWVPERSHKLLKIKKLLDSEATVLGYKWGRATDKGSKLLGLMGSLTCVWHNGVVFDLSGFTDAERLMVGEDVLGYGAAHEGEIVDALNYHNPSFPVGSKVTFKYREVTRDGAPKEARYWRKACTSQ